MTHVKIWLMAAIVIAALLPSSALAVGGSGGKPAGKPDRHTPGPFTAVQGLRHADDAHIMRAKGTTAARPATATAAPASDTGPLSYHGGPVMQTLTVYAVLWVPQGGFAISPHLSSLISQFLDDLGGNYANLLTQYSDTQGAIQNAIRFGGQWEDTQTALPHAGTTADPLEDSYPNPRQPNAPSAPGDIQQEVMNAVNANPAWQPPGLDTLYLVYLPEGVQSCTGHTLATFACSYLDPQATGAYCAYHDSFVPQSGPGPMVYANMSNTGGRAGCDVPQHPNQDQESDSEISVTSHELFESVTDPLVTSNPAWYSAHGSEIGDLCEPSNFPAGSGIPFPNIGPDGNDLVLNGHEYIVQSEFSNAAGACALPSNAIEAAKRLPACAANSLPANDDGSTAAIPLPFSPNYFGQSYSSLFVNNNGNVTFDAPLSTFTPFGLTSTDRVIIAPFFADVDTRGADQNGIDSQVVTYGGAPQVGSQPAYFCVNWVNVGYYGAHTIPLNSFQLVLTDRSGAAGGSPGDFDIEFNYDKVQWETGDASGGTGGLGGSSARVGFSNGRGTSLERVGSGVNGALLNGGADSLIRGSQLSSQVGRYVFQVRNGGTLSGGTIHGVVTAAATSAPVSGANVQACGTGQSVACFLSTTDSSGTYSILGLDAGTYAVTAFPPAGSSLFSATSPPQTLAAGDSLEVDLQLSGPRPPPAGTTITGDFTNPDGTPVLYWQSAYPITTHGCASGTGTWSLSAVDESTGQSSTLSGALTETPAGSGTYAGTIPAVFPLHGAATITISITCPSPGGTNTFSFDIYIDPSGQVVDTGGHPLAGATVTLLRADTAAGPFTPVPSGSAIMSPANRANPDTTTAGGLFGWDVLTGFYQVRASHDGCVSPADPTSSFVDSPVFAVPPPATNLTLTLSCQPVQAGPPTLDRAVSSHQATAASTLRSGPVTTAGANELVLAFVAADGPSSPTQSVTSVSGGGLTWSLVGRSNSALGTAEVWGAYATAPLASATITAALRAPGYDGTITVASFIGASPLVGASAIGGMKTGAPGASLTTTRANSLVWAVGQDWDHGVARTPNAGQALVDQFIDHRTDTTYWTQAASAPVAAAGTTVAVGDGAPTADRWDLTAVEITPASAAIPGLGVDTIRTADQVTPGSAFASPPVSTSAGNELVLALVSADGPSAPTQTVSGVSGGGLTWTRAARANTAWGTAEVWQAYTTSPLSGAVVTATLGTGSFNGAITVVSFAGARPTLGAVAAHGAATGAVGLTLTTTAPGSLVWATGHDWTHAAAVTPGTGQTLVNQFRDTSVHDSSWTQATGPVATAGAVDVTDGGPTTDRWELAAVEVVPAA